MDFFGHLYLCDCFDLILPILLFLFQDLQNVRYSRYSVQGQLRWWV